MLALEFKHNNTCKDVTTCLCLPGTILVTFESPVIPLVEPTSLLKRIINTIIRRKHLSVISWCVEMLTPNPDAIKKNTDKFNYVF